jgi:hypothetical protein
MLIGDSKARLSSRRKITSHSDRCLGTCLRTCNLFIGTDGAQRWYYFWLGHYRYTSEYRFSVLLAVEHVTGAFLGGANCALAVESRASGMGPT